jgi:RimJ/RimL family protein N-acetyltransferase
MPVPILATARLVLRPWRTSDLESVFAYASDPEFIRYLPIEPITTLEEERVWIEGQLALDPAIHPTWAITLDDVAIGGVNARLDPGRGTAEIGYGVGNMHWGKGFTTEAAGAVAGWLFAHTPIARLAATADTRNIGSWRVMEKLGMTREGVLRSDRTVRGERADTVVYSVLRQEWEARRR